MEFGSDFHMIDNLPLGKSYLDLLGSEYRLYTDGRQALQAILEREDVKRVWFPSYYCHDSIEVHKKNRYELFFYPCTPADNTDNISASLERYELTREDAVIMINYFGLKQKPVQHSYDFIVIEDHSHDLISEWAMESNADWCFASLRKTLPIADGGILWSPRNKSIPEEPFFSACALNNSIRRYAAMSLKADFIKGEYIEKDFYLKEFKATEEKFDCLPISAISSTSRDIISRLNISKWYNAKKRNWELLFSLINPGDIFKILEPEVDGCTPFSAILLFKNSDCRNKFRLSLIKNKVFPAILWAIPDEVHNYAKIFGDCMLSLHCDGRYSEEEITILADIINNIIKHD